MPTTSSPYTLIMKEIDPHRNNELIHYMGVFSTSMMAESTIEKMKDKFNNEYYEYKFMIFNSNLDDQEVDIEECNDIINTEQERQYEIIHGEQIQLDKLNAEIARERRKVILNHKYDILKQFIDGMNIGSKYGCEEIKEKVLEKHLDNIIEFYQDSLALTNTQQFAENKIVKRSIKNFEVVSKYFKQGVLDKTLDIYRKSGINFDDT